MLAYGGNGPLHACGIADKAGINAILFPPFASVFSALGACNMQPLHIHERSAYIVLYEPRERVLYKAYEELNSFIKELEMKGAEDLVRQGYNAKDVKYRLEMDMRYGNQLVTTAVSFEINRVSGVADVLYLIKTFADIFGERYGEGTQAPEAGVRVQTLRVASFIEGDVIKIHSINTDGERTVPEAISHKLVHFTEIAEPVETPYYDENALKSDHIIPGPALVTTESTTYLVEPGWCLKPTAQGAVWLLKNDVQVH
jgi:N-methylhydantoinase A